MKLFAKFLLVVTAISAVACSADIVDETTAVGNKTTISVSLQSTRTSLGEKGEESYPLYWSEGDRIAINGTSSEEAVINLDNCIVNTDGVHCGNCSKHCPANAIRMVRKEPDSDNWLRIPTVNESRCIGCGACENVCPARPLAAIHIEGFETHKLK